MEKVCSQNVRSSPFELLRPTQHMQPFLLGMGEKILFRMTWCRRKSLWLGQLGKELGMCAEYDAILCAI